MVTRSHQGVSCIHHILSMVGQTQNDLVSWACLVIFPEYKATQARQESSAKCAKIFSALCALVEIQFGPLPYSYTICTSQIQTAQRCMQRF